jgi:regulatory LuxR family protein
LQFIATGATNRALAHRLHVSPATIRNHTHNIFEKLGVLNRLAAVTYAVSQLLVSRGADTVSRKRGVANQNLGVISARMLPRPIQAGARTRDADMAEDSLQRGERSGWRTQWHDVAIALLSGRALLSRVRNLLPGAPLHSCLAGHVENLVTEFIGAPCVVPVLWHLLVLIGSLSLPLNSHESG